MQGYETAPPLWGLVLKAAEDWGCPPWEIADRPGGARWFERWQAYQECKRLAQPPPEET